MKISNITISKLKSEGKCKAIASFVIDDAFTVHNVRIIKSQNGLFVAMPSRKSSNGEYKDICHPITTELREQISNLIIKEFNKNNN